MKLLKIIFLIFVLLSIIDIDYIDSRYGEQISVYESSMAPKIPWGKIWQGIKNFFKEWHCSGCRNPKIPTYPIAHYLDVGNITSYEQLRSVLKKYLVNYQPNEKIKIIHIVQNDLRLLSPLEVEFYEGGELLRGIHLVEKAIRTIRCLEYSIDDMSKSYFNKDGVEYVSFTIPKKPQYIFGGEFDNHKITEDFIVTVRSNYANRVEQAIRKIFNSDYWDDAKFQQDCQTYDVEEIQQIKFVLIENVNYYEHIYKKTA